MADDNSFPKIHIDFVANGDYVHLRTDSGEEMAGVAQGFEANATAIFTSIGNIKQASLAAGVFSGNAAQPAQSTSQPAPSAPRAAANSAPGEQPRCERCGGETKDLRGKRDKSGNPYRNRYYCKSFNCKGGGWGEWVE